MESDFEMSTLPLKVENEENPRTLQLAKFNHN